jgi:tetratricopeptide (TPR) repeat protein
MTAHRHRSARGILIAAIAVCAARGEVRAQSGSAEALYAEGHRLLEQGELAKACEAFEASNRALPGAGTYLALGMCRERNGQIASAWSAYQAALARARDGQKRRFARTRIDEIEPRLSYLTVSVSADNADGTTLTRNGTLLDPMLWNPPSAPGIVVDDQAIAAFNGQSAGGLWTLAIQDVERDDVGTLDAWALSVAGSCRAVSRPDQRAQ